MLLLYLPNPMPVQELVPLIIGGWKTIDMAGVETGFPTGFCHA